MQDGMHGLGESRIGKGCHPRQGKRPRSTIDFAAQEQNQALLEKGLGQRTGAELRTGRLGKKDDEVLAQSRRAIEVLYHGLVELGEETRRSNAVKTDFSTDGEDAGFSIASLNCGNAFFEQGSAKPAAWSSVFCAFISA